MIKARHNARYKNDEVLRTKRNDTARLRNSVLGTCPDCKEEMQPASLHGHLKNRSCKGKPAE